MTGTNYGIAFLIGAAIAAATAAAIWLFFRLVWKRRMDVSPTPENATDIPKTEPSETGQFAAKHRIQLENLRRPDQKWQIALNGDLIIGRRENCKIFLSDPSVSRQQCKITDTEDDPVIWNLSKVNETQVNHMPVTEKQALKEGDVITMGREQLRVGWIRRLEDPVPQETTRKSPDDALPDAKREENYASRNTENFW